MQNPPLLRVFYWNQYLTAKQCIFNTLPRQKRRAIYFKDLATLPPLGVSPPLQRIGMEVTRERRAMLTSANSTTGVASEMFVEKKKERTW